MMRVENNHIFSVCVWFVMFFFLLPPTSLHAQSLTDAQAGATLSSVPPFPSPHQRVAVSLDAYSMNTLGATITWYLDKTELKSAKNERDVTFTVGEIGSKHVVRSVITFPSGLTLESSLSIPVTQIDIIIEADTYVPSFYRGRALPSEGAPVRVIAVTHTKGSESPLDYTYKWNLDGEILFGGPIRGKRVIELIMPQYQDHTLMVTIYDKLGSVLGERVVRLNSMEPEVYFYEDNPLRGTSRKAIGDDFSLTGEETTVFAEPYYINTTPGGLAHSMSWRLNGEAVNPTGSKPNSITLRHQSGEGSANIAFQYLVQKPLQIVESSFNIFFRE